MSDNIFLNEAINKQPNIVNHFFNMVNNHDLSHAYLLNGNSGVGKKAVAMSSTMALFCKNKINKQPCGKCNECRRITDGQHPDVVFIQPDGQSIKVEQVRTLKAEFSKRGVEGRLKVFIIIDAEKMTENAANSLLKFIEEPSGDVVSFLITTNKNMILPTIISRTQVIDFPTLSNRFFDDELKKIKTNPNDYNLLKSLTNSLETAKNLMNDDWFNKAKSAVENWFNYICKKDYCAFTTIQIEIMPLITDKNSKQQIINMMLQIWRDMLSVKYLNFQKNEIDFVDDFNNIDSFVIEISSIKLISIIQIMLECNNKMSINLNFQNILESTTLEILSELR
ncbi:DNA polymerase III subunit delta' [Apilactobacillus xinyiensis]|uniref:DNA polymerase III subunit delta' n=1 Tax=Apilactobacillus xinyiensis TaxID=2841032 RepID=UPI002010B77A|nr:DNA polymerase III subunit delta' [Apilactobacillus xinyiensis]MCL0330303.1 DNA polymerase III subunit delta' [Apilactobacillus xinyiensis]